MDRRRGPATALTPARSGLQYVLWAISCATAHSHRKTKPRPWGRLRRRLSGGRPSILASRCGMTPRAPGPLGGPFIRRSLFWRRVSSAEADLAAAETTLGRSADVRELRGGRGSLWGGCGQQIAWRGQSVYAPRLPRLPRAWGPVRGDARREASARPSAAVGRRVVEIAVGVRRPRPDRAAG